MACHCVQYNSYLTLEPEQTWSDLLIIIFVTDQPSVALELFITANYSLSNVQPKVDDSQAPSNEAMLLNLSFNCV